MRFFARGLRRRDDKATGTRRVETLAELLAQSHVLSLHCPLTPQTRHLIDMKVDRMQRELANARAAKDEQ